MEPALFQPFPMRPGRRAQVWRHQPAFRRPRHFHAEPEINLVLRGWARLGVGASERTLRPGELVFFHPGQDHVLLDGAPDLELFVLALDPALAERVVHPGRPPSAWSASLSPAELESLSEALRGVSDVASAEAAESVIAAVFELAAARMVGGGAAARRALEELLVAPHASLTELAARVRKHPSDLSRDFHRQYRVPLVELRARIRLMRFIEQVDAGDDLLRASFEAGFGSYSQCHRVFRRSLGCSPSAYFGGKRAQLDHVVCPGAPSSDLPVRRPSPTACTSRSPSP